MTEIFIILVAITTGVTEVIKRVGIKSKYAPLVSLVTGVALSFVFVGHDAQSLLQGVIAGLTASGLYSGGKAITTQ